MMIEQIQKIIKEIEKGALELLAKAGTITPSASFTKDQSDAIRDLRSGLRYWMGINLGEAKNAFDIGTKQELEQCRTKSAQRR